MTSGNESTPGAILRDNLRCRWLVLLILIAVGIGAAGYYYFRSEEKRLKEEHYRQLAGIAELKTAQIERWLRERFSDARVVTGGLELKDAVAEYRLAPLAPGPRSAIRRRFMTLWEGGLYENIFLLSNDGRPLLTLKDKIEPIDLPMKKAMDEVARDRKPVLCDFCTETNGEITLDILAPVVDSAEKTQAIVVLRGNAREFLFPLIRFWPTPSRTAESYLVRVEGNEVLFLTELRHRSGASLSLRNPLSETGLPAVQAALGRTGKFEGKDYTGAEVLADLRAIPGTPWFMVSNIASSEVLEEVRYRAAVVIVVLSLFVLLAGAMIALIYRTLREAEHKKAAEELRKSEAELRKESSLRNVLLDNLPCIALVLKKQTREIVACNEIAKGYGAVVGRTCHESIALQGVPCPFCMAPDLWETDSRKQIEVEYLDKFWQGIWVPFSEDLYVHYIFEITDRKRAESEMNKLQAQLQQAMKMEAVGRLAGGVAHDFNNLLTAIIGNMSLAEMQLPPSAPASGMIAEAKTAAERAAALTQQLLAFSRKQIIEPKILDLNERIAGLKSMIARLIGERIELQTVPGSGLGSVKVDPGQFEQVLVNLAVNARDAMPDGGELLIENANADIDMDYCALHPEAFPGRFVLLTVSDTGCGMGEEVRKHIFEPFFTTKPVGSGTGLGLSTIYGAVTQSDGFIEVDTDAGKGTTFRIYLPRVEAEITRREELPASQEMPGGTETVLLVEDEQIVRNLCMNFLDQSGYRVLPASNGTEAIDIAKEHKERIDLLLTDVVMPGMNGPEVANLLAALHPETKVLFTSGYTDDAIMRHGVLSDGVDFIGKPYSISALAKKIREVLEKT